jgi:hypothetical protein
MGNSIQRWFVAASISTLVFLGGSTALRAQGMRMTRPATVGRMMPSTMGIQTAPGRGMGNSMLFSPSGGFGGMGNSMLFNSSGGFGSALNGRTNSSGASGYGGGMGYGGGGSGGSSGYGSGSNSSMPSYQYDDQSAGYAGSSGYDNQNSKDSGSSAMFKAMGLPVEQGQLAWPIGLQALRPDEEVKTLRDQINGSIQVAAFDRMNKREDGRLVEQTQKAVARLRVLLRTNGKDRFFASTYKDSAQFLDQLEGGLKMLQGSPAE